MAKETIVGSPRLILSSYDWKKILIGLAVAVVGAGLTYVTAWISGADFGVWTPIIVAGFSVFANFVRKWIADNSGTTTITAK